MAVASGSLELLAHDYARLVLNHVTNPEPSNPPALGQEITRVEVLRPEERSLLRFVRNHGPLTMRKFARLYKLKPAVRLRILEDLDRLGLVACSVSLTERERRSQATGLAGGV